MTAYFSGPARYTKCSNMSNKKFKKMAAEKYLIFMFTLDIVHKIKYLSFV